MKVLLTGATGFLGGSILAALQREGYEVRVLVRPGRGGELENAEIVQGDITERESLVNAVQGVDFVVHAAARVETTGRWEEFAAANVRATQWLIRAASAAGVRRIVHVSSLSIYAVDRDGVTIDENSPYDSEAAARGGYSRSKLAADRVALYEARHGAPVVVLRPGLLYGPGKRPPVARQSFQVGNFKLLLARRNYPLPLTYIDNVADAVVLALRVEGIDGQAFTVVDDNVPQGQYVQLFREISGERWQPVLLPIGLVALSARILERVLRLARRRSPVTYHQVRRATDAAQFDCRKAHELLGWSPRVSLRDGLLRCFAARPNTGN